MVRIEARPEEFARLRRVVDAIPLSMGDKAGPLLRALDTEHSRQVRRAFSTEGGSVATGPWPSLSPGYAAWKRRQVGRKKMLRFTDTLFEKATSTRHGNHIALFKPPFSYSFGFRDEPGFYHQNALGHNPKRSLIDKTAEDIVAFKAILVQFWQGRLRQVLRVRGAA